MNQLVLLTISGPDSPGITNKLMQVIAKNQAEIADMGQSVTHGLLSLSILLNLKEVNQSPVLKDLLFESKKMKMELEFEVIEDHLILNDNQRSIIMCISKNGIQAEFLQELTQVLANNNINILRIDRFPKTQNFNHLELVTTAIGSEIKEVITKEFLNISDKYQTDLALLNDDIYSRNKRLIVFDMDSTLIQMEVIDELGKMAGKENEISQITEKAMNGEIDFDESLKQRVSLLKNLDASIIEEIANRLPLTEGLESLIKNAKSVGYKLAVISGGFLPFANKLKENLGLDYAFANNLEIIDNKLTGNVTGPIVNSQYKAFLLDLISQQEGISPKQVVAIGDGANDLPMLNKAGMGIAFHAKDIVRKNTHQRMSHGNMDSINYFLGLF